MIEYLEIGKVINTHGVKGEVKVLPLTDDPERYSLLKSVFIDNNGKLEEHKIESVRYNKGFVLLKLKGLNSIEDAEKFRNKVLSINREDAIKLPEGSYFICDLIGIVITDISGTELGTLEDVIKTGSNDVYIVKSKEKKEILIPALKTIIKCINIEQKTMLVDLPEEILDNEI